MSELLQRLQAAVGGRYAVEREVGQGGMSVVFRALDRKHGRTVAIKLLRPEIAAAIGHERFLREIEIAAKLQHPHILPVYDSGDDAGLLFYVMPYVEGESLRERILREGPLPPADAVRIAREVTAALDYAHRQNVVHRDIKPANILLSDGHAVVADFGIARAISASAGAAGLTQAGMAVGTPTYMSPEQALGEQNLDGRTDLYALGCVLHETLSGHPPFDGPTPQAVVAQVISGRAPKLARDPLKLQGVIDRALAKDPERRFATAAELTAALDAATSGAGYRFVGGRRRTGLVVSALAVAGVAAAVAFWPRGFRVEGDPRKSLIVFPFENRTGDPAFQYLEEGAMNLVGLAVAHWQDLRVYDDERTASLLRRRGVDGPASLDFAEAQAAARDAKVGTLVLGDIRREGDSLAVEGKIHDVRTGERLATEIVRAPLGADPRPLFDSLAARILHISGAPVSERPDVLAQTTSSLDAYRSYLAGVAWLQQFQIDSARASFQRAIALDSTFALAYVRLRDAEGWEGVTGNPGIRRELIARAQRYSASLPPRLRSLIEFHAAYERGDFRRARAIAEGMIARDSTDVEAWYQLGEAHFHHQASTFPPPDTVGNLGKALRAFQQALALDSSYLVAYRHILDGLNACAAPGNGVVCLADSAVYGLPADLVTRLGRPAVDRSKADARAAQLATARGWVSVAPNTPIARVQLAQALIGEQQWDEASRQVSELRTFGAVASADALQALIAFQRGKYRDAAAALSRVDSVSAMGVQPLAQWGTNILAGGGRIRAALDFANTLFDIIPLDSFPGPGGVPLPKASTRTLVQASVYIQTALPADSASATVRRWLDGLRARFGADTTSLREVVTAAGTVFLAAFLADRDTTTLTRFLGLSDTTGSSTWRVARAELALERGDTAEARTRASSALGSTPPNEFAGEYGLVRSAAWADVLARLGQLRDAADVLARIDSIPPTAGGPGFRVRSWAERGAVLQRLGRTAEAIEQYERFIDAWTDADPVLQPFVERARRTVAALKGEIGEVRR